jgi:hypothetical protein
MKLWVERWYRDARDAINERILRFEGILEDEGIFVMKKCLFNFNGFLLT